MADSTSRTTDRIAALAEKWRKRSAQLPITWRERGKADGLKQCADELSALVADLARVEEPPKWWMHLQSLAAKVTTAGSFQKIRRERENGQIHYQVIGWTEREAVEIAAVEGSHWDADFITAMFAQAPLLNTLRLAADPVSSLAVPPVEPTLDMGLDQVRPGNARCDCGHTSNRHACDHEANEYSCSLCPCDYFIPAKAPALGVERPEAVIARLKRVPLSAVEAVSVAGSGQGDKRADVTEVTRQMLAASDQSRIGVLEGQFAVLIHALGIEPKSMTLEQIVAHIQKLRSGGEALPPVKEQK